MNHSKLQSSVPYSAEIKMHLTVNAENIDIGQLAPNFLILRTAPDPPGDGDITFSIDGSVRRWPVRLPDGITAGEHRTRIADIPAIAFSSIALNRRVRRERREKSGK